MAALGKKLRTLQGGRYSFWCPGCEDSHVVDGGWTFNGDGDKPVFKPSVLVRSGHYAHDKGPGNCYCDFAQRHPEAAKGCKWKCVRCHSYVGTEGAQPGEIIFLSDCSHALAGKTVPLPDHPD